MTDRRAIAALGIVARAAIPAAIAIGCAAPVAKPPAPAPSPSAPRGPGATDDPWLAELQDELASLRELAFRRPVPWSHQSREGFRDTVRKEIARELPAAKAELLSRSAMLLGYLPRPMDLAAVLEEAQATQVAAYYDPREKVFRVVSNTDDAKEPAQPMIVAHELVHALQDQHFDLVAYQGSPDNAAKLSDDECVARRFVSEGEATFLMLARELGNGDGRARRLGPLAVASVRVALTMLAAADMSQLAELARSGDMEMDEEARAEMAALAELPPVIVLPLIEPYFKGAFFVSEVWGRGGWAAVSRLYAHPPASTEQVLHPEKFIGKPEPPIAIRLRSPPALPWAAGEPALTDVQGELGWRVYFATWNHPNAAAAATGWGGDRYWVWRAARGDDARLVGLTATRWDDEAAAQRFCADYGASLRKRVRGGSKVRVAAPPGEQVLALRGRSGTSVVACRGRDVDLIDGARESEIPALLQAARTASRD